MDIVGVVVCTSRVEKMKEHLPFCREFSILCIEDRVAVNCGDVWSNGVGQNREIDEEHDEDCVEEGFQLGRVKFDRHGEGGREVLGMGNSSINI